MSTIQPIILAAGKGTRLKADGPKVLTTVNGKTLLAYLLDTLGETNFKPPIVIVGFEQAKVIATLPKHAIAVDQGELKGTGHAVLKALPAVPADVDTLLVMCGDMPFWRPRTLIELVQQHKREAATITLAIVDDTSSSTAAFGRIVRDQTGRVDRIVEAKHATPAELSSTERNSSLYAIDAAWAKQELPLLSVHPETGEIYLTDLLERAVQSGHHIATSTVPTAEGHGINTPADLEQANIILQNQLV